MTRACAFLAAIPLFALALVWLVVDAIVAVVVAPLVGAWPTPPDPPPPWLVCAFERLERIERPA